MIYISIDLIRLVVRRS